MLPARTSRVVPWPHVFRGLIATVGLCLLAPVGLSEELQVRLTNAEPITFVGAFRRWDADGNPRKPVDSKAKIEAPEVEAEAESGADGVWTFRQLPEGRYDLVLLGGNRLRIEGFHYPPIAEFDPALPSDAPPPADDVRNWIRKDIAQARHYENKVTPLFMTGDRKQVRVFMQLLRDEPTSFDAEFGTPVATLRHEFWQYANRAGGWVKDKKTKVVDRTLLPKAELRRWTWVWTPELGGIEVAKRPLRVEYQIQENLRPGLAAGLVVETQP